MSFADIKGQDNALEILKSALEKGSIFSNYLFAGPDGVGKALTAVNFAKALNCQSARGRPCGLCVSCKKIDSGTHPDVFFIEPKGASHSVGIDEIREAINRANLKPYEGKKKVFIINSAHSMNAAASNAFLKTLEEPPDNTVFILISRSEKELLPTIASRSHTVRFFASDPELVERALAEKFNITKSEARVLSNFSSGRIGEAVRMKEEGLLQNKNSLLDNLSDKSALRKELESYANKEDLKKKMEFLISYLRDVFLYKTVGDEAAIFHIDRIDEIKAECEKRTYRKLESFIKKAITLSSYIDYNVNPKLIIGVLAEEASCIS